MLGSWSWYHNGLIVPETWSYKGYSHTPTYCWVSTISSNSWFLISEILSHIAQVGLKVTTDELLFLLSVVFEPSASCMPGQHSSHWITYHPSSKFLLSWIFSLVPVLAGDCCFAFIPIEKSKDLQISYGKADVVFLILGFSLRTYRLGLCPTVLVLRIKWYLHWGCSWFL